jgi:hypothetical protein
VVPLNAPDGPGAITPASCERVRLAERRDRIAAERNLATTFQEQVLG